MSYYQTMYGTDDLNTQFTDKDAQEPVRHGKWITKTIIIGGCEHVYGMKCSVCGEDALNAEGDEFLTDYCPQCGARMDEE